MSGYRLKQGGRINRSSPQRFRFDGHTYDGFAGDTLASALLANGVDIIGRSFKYHRPRGLVGAGLEEPNAVVQLESGTHTIPNQKATAVELYDGLSANPVNCWPNAQFDLMAINSLAARFLGAGFYYKTFMWPDWHLFEPSIRKAAGLGVSPEFPDPDIYDKRFAYCDLLVIGGGPAGLMAALVAARSGADVVLAEHDFLWGGSLNSHHAELDGLSGAAWAAQTVAELEAMPNVRLMPRTMAFGYYDHDLVGLIERRTDHLPLAQRLGPRQRLWKLRARHVIHATGAFERPIAFPNNDRPGVILASAAATYAARFGTAPGRTVVLATNNSAGYQQARSLIDNGVNLVAIADSREVIPEADRMLLGACSVEILPHTVPGNVRGSKAVQAVELYRLDSAGRAAKGPMFKISCDCVLTSGGWSPAVHMMSQSGGKLRFDDDLQAFVPRESVQNEASVGAANGSFGLAGALDEAVRTTKAALDQLGIAAAAVNAPNTGADRPYGISPLWSVDCTALGKPGRKAWLDFQNDVTTSDVTIALAENFQSVEHVKRYTTMGMASDQGKTSNVNAIGVMAGVLGKALPEVGTTKFRPPYDPVTIGAFAGRRTGDRLMPLRGLPSTHWLEACGAKLEDYGGWRRPAYIPLMGESEQDAIKREVLAVRTCAGLFDASPLGKIEVRGPDAAEFLTRMYVNNMATLKAGKCRYGLMLNENGIVYDDGVLACIGEGHFIVGTTSGHATAIAAMLEEWLQCEWLDLDVVIENVTTSWAVMNIAGPQAREILGSLATDIDLSAEAFPFMTLRSGTLAGVPCRIQRVSFSGELSYEVAVPWNHGAALWDALMDAGEEYGITAFGVESLMTMRIEKGFLHVGSDTDGTTLPQDVGFGGIIAKKRSDFVGRRSTMRPDALRADRRELVGLELVSGGIPIEAGAHVLNIDDKPPTASRGWVTSSTYSPTLERPLAMALVERGRSRMGEEVKVWDMGQERRARICEPGGYDPKGEKQNG